MVVVVGDIAVVVVLDVPTRVRVRISDRHALAVRVPRTIDLIRRSSDAPIEAIRELARGRHQVTSGRTECPIGCVIASGQAS